MAEDVGLLELLWRLDALLGEFCRRSIRLEHGVDRAAPADVVDEVQQLKQGLVTRTVVGQAHGMLIERHRTTPEAAF